MKDRGGRDHHNHQASDFLERIIHDAGEFGEDNVEQVDEEWAEFERVLRYGTFHIFYFLFCMR